MTLAFKMPTQKFLDIVSIADIDAEEHVDDSWVKILKLIQKLVKNIDSRYRS